MAGAAAQGTEAGGGRPSTRAFAGAGDDRVAIYDDAVLYDVIHTPGTAREVRGLLATEARFATAAARACAAWLEPGCGTGRYLRPARAAGRRVIGFDLREPIVRYAARRMGVAPADWSADATLFVADMLRFAGLIPAGVRGRVGFAFNMISTIRHLATDDEMLAHFDEVARVLHPGGVYVIGLSLARYGAEFPSEDTWTGSRGTLRVTQVLQYEPGTRRRRRETVLSHVVARTPRSERHEDDRYELRTYDRAEWEALIARSALRVVGGVDEDGLDYEPRDGGAALYVLGHARRGRPGAVTRP